MTSEPFYNRVEAPRLGMTSSLLFYRCFVYANTSVEKDRKMQWASAKFTDFGKRRFGTGCASIVCIRMIKYTKSHNLGLHPSIASMHVQAQGEQSTEKGDVMLDFKVDLSAHDHFMLRMLRFQEHREKLP